MFINCFKLKPIDLSGLIGEFLTDVGYMFRGCSSLTSIDLSNFDSKKSNGEAIFSGFYTRNGTLKYNSKKMSSNILKSIPSCWTLINVSNS